MIDREEGRQDRLALDVREVQRILGRSRSSVYRAVSTGKIRGIRGGRRVLIACAALQQYLRNEGDEASVGQRGRREV